MQKRHNPPKPIEYRKTDTATAFSLFEATLNSTPGVHTRKQLGERRRGGGVPMDASSRGGIERYMRGSALKRSLGVSIRLPLNQLLMRCLRLRCQDSG